MIIDAHQDTTKLKKIKSKHAISVDVRGVMGSGKSVISSIIYQALSKEFGEDLVYLYDCDGSTIIMEKVGKIPQLKNVMRETGIKIGIVETHVKQ